MVQWAFLERGDHRRCRSGVVGVVTVDQEIDVGLDIGGNARRTTLPLPLRFSARSIAPRRRYTTAVQSVLLLS